MVNKKILIFMFLLMIPSVFSANQFCIRLATGDICLNSTTISGISNYSGTETDPIANARIDNLNNDSIIGYYNSPDNETDPIANARIDNINNVTNNIRQYPTNLSWSIWGDSLSNNITGDYIETVIDIIGFSDYDVRAVPADKINNQLDDLHSLIASNSTYFNNYDIISLMIGVNDFNVGTELGDLNDTINSNTVAGMLMNFTETLLKANSNITFYLITTEETNYLPNYPYKVENSAGWDLRELSILTSQIAREYGVKVIDLYSTAQFNLLTIGNYTSDKLHPNDIGKVKIGEIVAEAFSNKHSKGTIIDPMADTIFYRDLIANKRFNATEICLTDDSCKTSWPTGGSGSDGTNITIGSGNPTDSWLKYDGNTIDYIIGLDDSSDNLIIDAGTTFSTSSAIQMNNNGLIGIGISPDSSYPVSIKSNSATVSMKLITNTNEGAGIAFQGFDIYSLDNVKVGFFASNSNDGNFLFGTTKAGGSINFWSDASVAGGRMDDNQNWYLGTNADAINRLDVDGAVAIGSSYAGTNTAPTNGLLVEGNIGVGTTSPLYKLDVAGNTNVLGSLYLTDSGGQFSAIYQDDLTNFMRFNGWNGINFQAGSNTYMTLTGSGNVGIGTTTPNSNLNIKQGSLTEDAFTITSSTGNSNRFKLKTSSDDAVFIMYDSSNNIDIQLTSDGNTYFNGGNIGIGTTTPAKELDVNGAIAIRSSGSSGVIGSGNGYGGSGYAAAGRLILYDSSSGATSLTNTGGYNMNFGVDNSIDITIKTGGNVGIGTTAPQNKLDIEGGTVIGATYSGTNTAPTNGLLVQGNVGIGTTNPTGVLEVSKNNARLYINREGGTAGSGLYWRSNSDVYQGSITTNNNSDISFHTHSDGTNAKMFIEDSTGNIGIGTSSPNETLSIIGSIEINGTKGFTGSCGSGTTLTIKAGLITGCS